MIPVLHEDDALLVVDKPTGLATIPERDPSRDCVLALLSAERASAAGRLWVVHRLDKDVSGVLLFAKTATSHRALSLQFERREVRKTYVALVHGDLASDAGSIDAPLRAFGSGRVGVDRPRGKPSLTHYRVLARQPGATLLELSPHTGRRHQLRAHLASIGHPIVGDPQYGKPADTASRAHAAPRLPAPRLRTPLLPPPAPPAFTPTLSPPPRLMLHALRLVVVHPVSGAELTLHAPLPECLARCGA